MGRVTTCGKCKGIARGIRHAARTKIKNISIAEMPTTTQGRADVTMRCEAKRERLTGRRGIHGDDGDDSAERHRA